MKYKKKTNSAIKKRFKLSGTSKVRFPRSVKQHGMMKRARSRLHQKKRMGVDSANHSVFKHILKALM